MGRLSAALAALLVMMLIPVGAVAASPALVHFTSTVNPYSIAYPAGWRHQSGHLSGNFSLFSFDEFYNPAPSHGFHVNLVVSQVPVPYSLTTAGYVQQSDQSLQDKGLAPHQIGVITVAAHRVPVISYTDTRTHVQAYLVASQHVWVFSLTTAIGDDKPWMATYRAMLRSVKLR
jgi:hypothetical protein